MNLPLLNARGPLQLYLLFLVVFNDFFLIPVVKENKRLKLELAIPTGVPVMLEKEIIDVH